MSDKEFFYKEVTLQAAYEKADFGFDSTSVLLIMDGTGDLVFSWSGTSGSIDGVVKAADIFLAMDDLSKSHIFVKGTNPGDVARLFAWRRSG